MRILDEDAQVLVCVKEAGMPVQTKDTGRMDLVSRIRNHLKEAGKEEGIPYLGIIHRLDQPVEGVMIFAKTPQAARELSQQNADQKIRKKYLAVTRKDPGPGGRMVDYLLRDGKKNCSFVVSRNHPDARQASLSYQLLEEAQGYYLIEVELHTGRHHQIRVQFAERGCPLAGDRKYGPPGEAYHGNVALCSGMIGFCHPQTKEWKAYRIRPAGEIFERFESLDQKFFADTE